jgi:CheY-like chemotaxis protein
MDVYMPVLDGLQATRAIRAHPSIAARHQPYIIAVTANAMSGDQETCLKAGMNDYVSKPVTSEAISAALTRAWVAFQS